VWEECKEQKDTMAMAKTSVMTLRRGSGKQDIIPGYHPWISQTSTFVNLDYLACFDFLESMTE